jgi:outer membrane murein-binding lipoprotein Lpp
MKWIVVIGAAALVLVAPSQADTRTEQRSANVARLNSEISTLKRQVAALQKQVKAMQRDVSVARNELNANFVGDACLAALASDGLVTTWTGVDQYGQRDSGTTVFGAQPRVNDKQACSNLRPGVLREYSATTNTFQALIGWLLPGS